MAENNIRAHVYIQGRVQGVNYRGWTRKAAQNLGLTGWVKNLVDGRVEAVFEGPKRYVEEIIKKCRDGSTHDSLLLVLSPEYKHGPLYYFLPCKFF